MDESLASLYTTQDDAHRYYRESVIELVIIFIGFLAYHLAIIPFWFMAVLLIIAYPRYIIMLHELFHIRKAEAFGFFYRILPVPVTPFTVGYREYVLIHNAHHKGPASEHDLDAFQIRGNRLKSFLGALFSPEIHFFRWIINEEINKEFIIETFVRITMFIGLAILTGVHFLWFWISLKIIYGLASFIFFNLVHYRGGRYGTFETELPIPLMKLAELIWGRVLVHAVMYHNIHHDNVRISAQHLQQARSHLATSI